MVLVFELLVGSKRGREVEVLVVKCCGLEGEREKEWCWCCW